MLTLAFDTATSAVTVAVADGSNVLAEASISEKRRHGEVLAPAIGQVLATAAVNSAALETIVVGVGPGPYTGLRVGLVTAQSLGFALGVPVVGVCTLDVLAADAVRSGVHGTFMVATDARRKEVYWAMYDASQQVLRVQGPDVSAPADVATELTVVGEGAALYPEAFPHACAPMTPSAAAMCRWLADGLPTLAPRPLYLRRPDAAEPGARKRVTGPA